MRARWLLMLAGALVVGALAFAAKALMSPSDSAAGTRAGGDARVGTATDPATTFTPRPLTPAAARTLEADATSGTETRVRAALSIPAGQNLDPALVSGLAKQAPLQVEQETFHQLSDATSTVTIRTGGAQGGTWVATLVWDGHRWRIALTTQRGRS